MAKKSYKFAMTRIRDLGYSYQIPETLQLEKIGSQHQIHGNHVINYHWNLEQNYFSITMDVTFFKGEDDKKTQILRIACGFDFIIESLKDYLTVRSGNDFDMEEHLEVSLVGIVISTMRGIIFEKTKGLTITNFILPLMDPKKQSVSYKLQQHKNKDK
jgi:hypothetical protein